MNPRSAGASPSAIKRNPKVESLGRAIFRALLLVSALLSGGLVPGPADANLLITTTGTITSGSETGGLFGLPTATTSLVGDSYTLIVGYGNLGPNYFSTGDGNFAQDNEDPGLTGFVTAIINGHSLTTLLTNSFGSMLLADMFDFNASNSGSNAAGAFVDVSQSLGCNDVCVPFADLITPVNYVLGPNDVGTDLFTFLGAGFPGAGAATATFVGTELTFAAVPEPPSWALLAAGLLGLCLMVRRRRA